MRTRVSVHIFVVEMFELRLGFIFPFWQSFSIHPGLYRAVHQEFLSLFPDRCGELAPSTQVQSVRGPHPCE